MSGSAPCPTLVDLEALVVGGAVRAEVARHVESCPRCVERVEAIRSDNALLGELVAADRGATAGDGASGAPAEAPEGYERLEEIHRGSQGIVYRAVQKATRRIVAVKVMIQGAFPTERQRLRFDREVELVASLRHPNVVTVHDSGIDGAGRPYLVMEYVEGLPLDRHLAARGAAGDGPDLRGRLDLFARIAEAVDAAHRRGIIHRDLKPANILVDAGGEPKVLDFGLAKAVGREGEEREEAGRLATVAGEFLGTFAYAAPEQVAGMPDAVDTRTDIYALGVILYELTTGRRPHELSGSLADVVRTIAEREPPPPSSVGGALAGGIDRDVETIVLTALAKAPDRRYQTVREMIEDVRGYLRGEAIRARRGERLYVLGKTIRRHRLAVSIAASILIGLIGITVKMWDMYQDAVRADGRRAHAMASLLETIGSSNREDPDAPVSAITIIQWLDEAARVVDEELGDLPADAAAVHATLGLANLSHSRFTEAERHLTAALALRQGLHEEPHAEIAASLHDLGRLHWKRGRYRAAERLYRRALEMRRAVLGDGDPETARTMQHLASTLRELGRLDEAEPLFREALARRRVALGDGDPAVAGSLHVLGNCLHDRGRPEEAIRCYRDALTIIAGAEDFRVARAWHNIASCLIDLGHLDEAEEYLNRSLTLKERIGSRDDLEIASNEHVRARLLLARGEATEAEARCQRALDIRRRLYAERHPSQADSLALLGRIAMARGRGEEAEALLREALEVRRATQAEGHWEIVVGESLLEACLAQRSP